MLEPDPVSVPEPVVAPDPALEPDPMLEPELELPLVEGLIVELPLEPDGDVALGDDERDVEPVEEFEFEPDEPEDDDCAYATDAKPSAAAATTTGIFFIMISFVTVGQRRGITRNRQGRSGKSAKPVA